MRKGGQRRPGADGEATWSRRPGAARVLRVAVFGAPVLASFGAAYAVRTSLPAPTGLLGRALGLAVLVVVSTAVLLLIDRLARTALPLATLLDLTMLFPDRAPSRLGVARDAIRRRPIEEQLQRVRDAGADPGAVAREILALVAALSVHDRPTRGHAERVRMFTDLLAEQMRIPARDRDLLRWASILHDIGKLHVPASLLNKPGKPTEDEWVLLKAHPSHGADMAAGLLPWLGEWGAVIVEHHERYDGTGYPAGIAGRQISIGARIVSVADAYDVMTAARAYKRPVSRAAACRELVRFSGTQFDPAVVRAMVAVGAPRLRRAQGIVSWVADIPLVASGTVPAATVARLVGAGALATGAVTGGVAVADTLEPVPRQASAVTVADRGPSSATASATGLSQAGDRVPQPEAAPRPTTSDAGEASLVAGPVAEAPPGDASPAAPPPTGSAGSERPSGGDAAAPDAPAAPDSPGSPVAPVGPGPAATSGPLAGTVDSVTETVGGIVRDPVGTVTGTVGGVVKDPVGTVVGTAGGLLGPGPSPTPTPASTTSTLTPTPTPTMTSTSSGGLVGSLVNPLGG